MTVPIGLTEDEIIRTQKELDDADWHGQPIESLQSKLKQLYVSLSLGDRGRWDTPW